MIKYGRLSLVVAFSSALLAGGTRQADAQNFFFAFLIDHGWQAFFANPVVRADHALTSWAADRPFHLIANGQKGGQLGQAHVRAWHRAVPDPFYAPIGPTAGVITLDFEGFRGHLSLIETPSGFRTSTSIIEDTGAIPRVTGTWVFGNGADVIGGTANDMVIGGIVHFGTAMSLGTVEIPVHQYFPTVPFPSDVEPLALKSVNASTQLGSYYGASDSRPIRTYRRHDTQWTGFAFDAWLAVLHVPGDSYLIVVTSYINTTGMTISGVGDPLLAALTGGGHMTFLPAFAWKFVLTAFVAP